MQCTNHTVIKVQRNIRTDPSARTGGEIAGAEISDQVGYDCWTGQG